MFSRTLIAIAFACELTAQNPSRLDPEQQLWMGIKHALISTDGEEYFQSSMKDAMLPRLKGTLIAALPNDSGNALVLSLTDSKTPEVALLLHELPSEMAPGAQIEFSAVPIGFTRDPFLVTFDTGKDTIVLKPLARSRLPGMSETLWALCEADAIGTITQESNSTCLPNGPSKLQGPRLTPVSSRS